MKITNDTYVSTVWHAHRPDGSKFQAVLYRDRVGAELKLHLDFAYATKAGLLGTAYEHSIFETLVNGDDETETMAQFAGGLTIL
ncbi:MAG TPA: hypothetical protein VGC41_27595, partial [Kofleriaceae bacterium]